MLIYFNTFYDYLYYYPNALQTPIPNAEFTRRLYSVHAARSQRAHGALEDPKALPQKALPQVVQMWSAGTECTELAFYCSQLAFSTGFSNSVLLVGGGTLANVASPGLSI